MNPQRIVTDGGTEDTKNPHHTHHETVEINVGLPEDSIFDLEDYLKMYDVASGTKQFRILTALAEENELSTSELSMKLELEDNALHYPLRTLKEVALIRNRRDPNTGTNETYSYYTLTDMGRIILTEGIAEGIKTLAREETALEDKYSR